MLFMTETQKQQKSEDWAPSSNQVVHSGSSTPSSTPARPAAHIGSSLIPEAKATKVPEQHLQHQKTSIWNTLSHYQWGTPAEKKQLTLQHQKIGSSKI